MILRSLKLRLLVIAGLAIAAALGVAWFTMGTQFERHLQRKLSEDLIRNSTFLLGTVRLDAKGAFVVDGQLGDPRFDTPAGGAYWSLRAPNGSIQSRSLWDSSLPIEPGISRTAWRTRLAPGPFEQDIILVERLVQLRNGGPDVLIQMAENEGPLDQAADQFQYDLSYFVILLWLFLAGAVWVQVTVGLWPLRRLSRDLRDMQRAPGKRLGESYPSEVRALTEAINALADAREEDVRRARHRAADLAHALKTPLAALAAQSRMARRAGAIEAADGLDGTLSAAAAALESELARARAAAHRQSLSDATCYPLAQVEALFEVLSRTETGGTLVYEVDIDAAVTIPVEPETFTEIFGNLLDNASRFARRRVRVAGSREKDLYRISVDDDGPGIAEEEMERAIIRGARLDESGGGHGLGLAIARDLIEASGGEMKLARAAFGGLAVILVWPDGAAA